MQSGDKYSGSTDSARHDLLQIYTYALAAVEGSAAVHGALLEAGEPVSVIATGKAASAMMAGAEARLGKRLAAGFLVTKNGHIQAAGHGPDIELHQAGHPLPNADSLQAGQALLDFIARQPVTHSLLFLISGGTSSLVEVLADGVSLAHLIRENRALLGSGLSIDKINQQRRQLSRLKGGGLGQMLDTRSVQALLISDVPDDDPAVIGSGMLLPADNIDIKIIACLDDALDAARVAAGRLGYDVTVQLPRFNGDAATLGREFAQNLLQAQPGVYIQGGESTVQLAEQPGQGGRNQHLALAAAIALDNQPNIMILAAGTDGTDGPTEDAGALVDGMTVHRGELAELDAIASLARFDAGRFLSASGDLIHTGPTGTNVMDLLIGIKW